MPSLPQQTIPAAGVQRVEIRSGRRIAVLKITNESANIMRIHQKANQYGDPVPANHGSVALHLIDRDKPPHNFFVTGTAADTFAIYYEVL